MGGFGNKGTGGQFPSAGGLLPHEILAQSPQLGLDPHQGGPAGGNPIVGGPPGGGTPATGGIVPPNVGNLVPQAFQALGTNQGIPDLFPFQTRDQFQQSPVGQLIDAAPQAGLPAAQTPALSPAAAAAAGAPGVAATPAAAAPAPVAPAWTPNMGMSAAGLTPEQLAARNAYFAQRQSGNF